LREEKPRPWRKRPGLYLNRSHRSQAPGAGIGLKAGKRRSRQNAVRHGLTAETVIDALEDAEDYAMFYGRDLGYNEKVDKGDRKGQ
jgi:hypothetical protein